MSVEASTRVWKYSRQNGTALLVLLALADWADDWGYCYPGHAAIARKTRTTERNVYMLLRKLDEAGEIRVIRRGQGGKRKETSIYQVIVGMSENEIIESEKLTEFTPENFSPEKSRSALNVLINRHINAAVNYPVQQQNDVSPENFSPENFSGEKLLTEKPRQNGFLPPEVQESLTRMGWRGPLTDVEQAWREDPERVRQWLWYARRQGWSGALLRTVLRNPGEYPPELEPGSEAERRQRQEDMRRFGVYSQDDFEAADDDDGESFAEIRSKLSALRCEDLLTDIEAAWQEDPERIRQWTWYALSFAHGRERFRSAVYTGEYPPRLKPGSRVNPVER